jgi:glycosyltransferase involved in cell wall biosynthesis
MLMRSPEPPIRVLVLARLFAGLKPGLAAGKWEPRGVPAIYKLLEGLAADPEIRLSSVFCLKEPDERFARAVRRSIAPIGDTLILPFRALPGGRRGRIASALTEAEHTTRLLVEAARFRPDVIYATYANVHAAALIARAGHKGVVLRFMGVVPHHRDVANGALPVFGWQLRAPFARAISTEDGSDPGAVLPRLLRSGVPTTIRLNGCDAEAPDEAERTRLRGELGLGARPVVVFVARLEPYKGCLDFIDAASEVLRRMPGAADFIVVGDGPLKSEMETRVARSGHSAHVRFTGSVPHKQAYAYVGASDVYVSINLYGNLSNANLEALAAGACLVFPTSDPSIPLDTVTDTLIPPDVALRYDRSRLPGSLADELTALVARPVEIARRQAGTRELAAKLVRPWSRCIADDIAELKAVAFAARRRSPIPQPA